MQANCVDISHQAIFDVFSDPTRDCKEMQGDSDGMNGFGKQFSSNCHGRNMASSSLA